MGVRTREQYIESLRRQKPNVYMDGERVENLVDHPAFRVGINSVAMTYDLCNDSQHRGLARLESPLIGEAANQSL